MRNPFAPMTPDEAAANRARAVLREAHRREAQTARAALATEMPWLDDSAFPEAAVWRPIIDLVVQPTGPRHAWYWGGSVPDGRPMTIPAGTALGPPAVDRHGPPVGAYVCSTPPDDGRDDEPWWGFRPPSAIGLLEAEAVIEMRPGHGVVIVPDGHRALVDPALAALAVLALDA